VFFLFPDTLSNTIDNVIYQYVNILTQQNIYKKFNVHLKIYFNLFLVAV